MWDMVKLGDVLNVKSSKRIFASDYVDSGIPFFRSKEVSELSRNLETTSELYIAKEKYLEIKEKFGIPKAGDILITSVGTIGKVWIVDDREFYYKDGNLTQIEVTEEFDSKFLMYYFRSSMFLNSVQKGSAGSAYSALTIQKLKNVLIPQIPLDIQEKIAAVLEKADNLISMREKQLIKLDELLQSVFLDMFGDPVTNPKGWDIKTLAHYIESTQYGSSSKAGDKGGFPILRMGNITYGGEFDFTSLKYLDLDEKEQSKYLVHKNDILFNRTNSKDLVGKTAIYTEEKPMAYAGYLVKLNVNKYANPHFVSTYMNSGYVKTYLKNKCNNIVGMANINAKEIQKLPMPVVPIELQNQFAVDKEELCKRKHGLVKSIDKYQQLFASLTQQAFSGGLELV